MTKRAILVLACLATLARNAAAAEVPQLLNYQGRLSDSGGVPQSGSFSMQFRIYDSASGGTQLPSGTPWTETQSVAVSSGVFNVLLGSVTPLPDGLFEGGPTDSLGPQRFLDITIGGENLAPRQRIASVPYALHGQAVGGGDEWAFVETVNLSGDSALSPLLPADAARIKLVFDDVGFTLNSTFGRGFIHLSLMNATVDAECTTTALYELCGGSCSAPTNNPTCPTYCRSSLVLGTVPVLSNSPATGLTGQVVFRRVSDYGGPYGITVDMTGTDLTVAGDRTAVKGTASCGVGIPVDRFLVTPQMKGGGSPIAYESNLFGKVHIYKSVRSALATRMCARRRHRHSV